MNTNVNTMLHIFDSERSDDCRDFTMMKVFYFYIRKYTSIFNFEGGFMEYLHCGSNLYLLENPK